MRTLADKLWISIIAVAVITAIPQTSRAETPPSYLLQWGVSGSGNAQFNYPTGVAVDGSGNVYVADRGNSRIQKFNSTGGFLTTWGSSGSGNGQFNGPTGVAADGSGNVYVADTYNDRIQKFTSTGGFLTTWGSYGGSGPGQFSSPSGVAVDSSGNVYVADTYNNLIQKFTSDGTFLSWFGVYHPISVAVDGSGNVYVVGGDSDFIQKHASDGTYLAQWGSSGSGNGQFSHPQGVAEDGSGNVYVADAGNNRIQKFQQNIWTIAASAGANGSISPSGAVSVGAGGSQTFTIAPASCFNIADVLVDGVSVGPVTSYTFNNITANHTIAASFVQTTLLTITASAGAGGYISPSGAVIVCLGASQPFTIGPNACHVIVDVVVDGVSVGPVTSYTFTNVAGNHTIAASFAQQAYRTITASAGPGGSVNPSGANSVCTGGSQTVSIAPASCFTIADVLVDGGSVGPVSSYTFTNITADHTLAASFVAFGSCYRYLAQWGSEGTTDGLFEAPNFVALDSGGNVYVTDFYNYRVQKFTGTGTFLMKWGHYGSADQEFDGLYGIALDDSDNVYVPERYNDRIQKFTNTGTFLIKWTASQPIGVAIGPRGDVYVTSVDGHVYKFTAGGAPLLVQPGFSSPLGVAVDDSGNVYVTEYDGNRVQKLDPDLHPLMTWGGPGSGASQFNNPTGVACDHSGNVYVVDGHNYRVQKFTRMGELLTMWGSSGSGDGQFGWPVGVAVAGSGEVYVVDQGNNRIQKFGFLANTDVGGGAAQRALALAPPVPNPWTGQTALRFVLARRDRTTLTIYDVLGRRLRQWSWSSLSGGPHEVVWDGRTDAGQPTGPGILFYRLESGGQTLKQKMIRLQ